MLVDLIDAITVGHFMLAFVIVTALGTMIGSYVVVQLIKALHTHYKRAKQWKN